MTENRPAPEPPKTGSAAIVTRLRQAILDGKYPYQSKLPPERELARFFGMSRGTVRTALRKLEELGLLDRRIGSGTFVVHKTDSHAAPQVDQEGTEIAETTSPLELIEGRLAIEPHMAQLAVLNATIRDLEGIRAVLEDLEASAGDSERFSRHDERFHLAIAAASHNRLIHWLYRKLNSVRSHAAWGAMKRSVLTADNIDIYNREHRRVYQALLDRNAESARAAITSHLDHARRDLLKARSG